MKQILIKNVGFIGDNLFATSIARKFKDRNKYNTEECEIDYLLSVKQPYELYRNDPNIRNVFLSPVDESIYDEVYTLKPIHRRLTPIEQFQQQCGLTNLDTEYKVYTNKHVDEYVKHYFSNLQFKDKKLVTFLTNWEERSFLFTEEQYNLGIDVPNLGYGGAHRNIKYILHQLSQSPEIVLIPVGKPQGTSQHNTDLFTISEYSLTASLIKNSDYFIGAEGGLANLAAGVGTKTIITGDFVHQLYGWNGVIEKCHEPKLGPKYYFPEAGHITLNPYLTDQEVAEQMRGLILE